MKVLKWLLIDIIKIKNNENTTNNNPNIHPGVLNVFSFGCFNNSYQSNPILASSTTCNYRNPFRVYPGVEYYKIIQI